MWADSFISLASKITVHTQYSECVRKSILYDPTINRVSITAKLSRITPGNMVNTKKNKLLFSAARTFWFSVAIMSKYRFDQLFTIVFSPFGCFGKTQLTILSLGCGPLFSTLNANFCCKSFLSQFFCGCPLPSKIIGKTINTTSFLWNNWISTIVAHPIFTALQPPILVNHRFRRHEIYLGVSCFQLVKNTF